MEPKAHCANCSGIPGSVPQISRLLREIWHKHTHKASIVRMNALDFLHSLNYQATRRSIDQSDPVATNRVIKTRLIINPQANQWHVTAKSSIPYIHPNGKMIVWESLDPYPSPQSKTPQSFACNDTNSTSSSAVLHTMGSLCLCPSYSTLATAAGDQWPIITIGFVLQHKYTTWESRVKTLLQYWPSTDHLTAAKHKHRTKARDR